MSPYITMFPFFMCSSSVLVSTTNPILHGLSMLTDKPVFVSASIQFDRFGQFFSVFHWSPSIGKPPITPVSFVKTSESYEVSLITISRQPSCDSDVLRRDYGIIRGLLAESLSGCTVSRTDCNGPNNRIGPDCAGRTYLQ